MVVCVRWRWQISQLEDILVDKCVVCRCCKAMGCIILSPSCSKCNLSNFVLHILRQRLPSACPRISVAMPALILCRPNVSTELDLDAFLMMNYTVVQNTWHFGLVRICTIWDYLYGGSPLRSLSHFPSGLVNSTWTWCPVRGRRWLQADQDQGLRATAGNNAGSWFPQWAREPFVILSNVASSASMSCQRPPLPNWISFSFASTKCFRRKAKLFRMRSNALWSILVKIRYHQQQSQGLDLQWKTLWALGCREEWM